MMLGAHAYIGRLPRFVMRRLIRLVCVDLYGGGPALGSGLGGTRDINEGTTIRERPKRLSAPV